ncbi:Oxysterol-binding protein [Basidiobolus meristosporus CBS 931.73]|uniref:Oxysterol-binding protein n=1 Tax=Basidiobolus meristosporus CBS 931.73 TaxID=1314790 RepID=A0A1Y1Y333_9FUNG|nr:Oxysterol-binding protein [Basidiobolus meristosporus CBS 931.73]|eukprot:ORX92126.1 Oxysterol-binding protein [Basidiobolus meristosporus CBS 931.73]
MSEHKEVLDDEPRSILLGIISQLTRGTDLSRVTLPVFILEPRSFLEKVTDFMSHPDLIQRAAFVDDPLERFIQIVRYYLSGWHIQPKGVKKPYNPVLGEHFRCKWTFPDSTEAFYIAEQVSHHPPITAYAIYSPENYLLATGELKPKSKFLGNSAASMLHGSTRVQFLNIPGEEYFITYPNIYARGILFGTMMMELGDHVTVSCPQNDFICNVEFKTKGFFSGTYNAIVGTIKKKSTGEVLFEIGGNWSDKMNIRQVQNGRKGPWKPFLDVNANPVYPKTVVPEAQQEPYESRRLWSKVTDALRSRNLNLATDEKTSIEDNQRRLTKERNEKDLNWVPRFFTYKNGQYIPILNHISADPKTAKAQIEQFIFSPHEANVSYQELHAAHQ